MVSIGILWFKEPMTAIELIGIGVIIAGITGLNLGGELLCLFQP